MGLSLLLVLAGTVFASEEVEQFLAPLKRGTPVELTLSKGKVIRGLFSSYDDYYETVWIVPQGERGVFNEKGIKLSGISKAILWDRKATIPPASTSSATPNAPNTIKEESFGSNDYELLKDDLKK